MIGMFNKRSKEAVVIDKFMVKKIIIKLHKSLEGALIA